jgi:nucleotide-binding universal stress UspA family protein
MYQRILVPLDGSDTSSKALEEALRLAGLSGARVDLLHVVEGYGGGYVPTDIYYQDVLPQLVQQGERLLAQAAGKARERGVATETVLIDGGAERVSTLILRQAEARNADLIVLGTHGRRGIGRLLLGSDAEQVARSAPIPVLLVRGTPPT